MDHFGKAGPQLFSGSMHHMVPPSAPTGIRSAPSSGRTTDGRCRVDHASGAMEIAGSCRPSMTSFPAGWCAGLLCPALIDGRRGLDGGGEHHGHAVGDAAVDAAVVVGARDQPPVFNALDCVVGTAAEKVPQSRSPARTARPDGGHAVKQRRKLTFHRVEEGFADACGQAGDCGFEHRAHGIPAGGGIFDQLSCARRIPRPARGRRGVQRGEVDLQRIPVEIPVADALAGLDVRTDADAVVGSICSKIAPAATSPVVTRPEKCPPPRAS